MKLKYFWMVTEKLNVHTPSTDYYARSGDHDTDSIEVVCNSIGPFDSEDDAISSLPEYLEDEIERCYLVKKLVGA